MYANTVEFIQSMYNFCKVILHFGINNEKTRKWSYVLVVKTKCINDSEDVLKPFYGNVSCNESIF